MWKVLLFIRHLLTRLYILYGRVVTIANERERFFILFYFIFYSYFFILFCLYCPIQWKKYYVNQLYTVTFYWLYCLLWAFWLTIKHLFVVCLFVWLIVCLFVCLFVRGIDFTSVSTIFLIRFLTFSDSVLFFVCILFNY